MLRLFWSTLASFRSGRLWLRGAAVLGIALLLAGGSLISPMGAAHASGCAHFPPTSLVHTATSANTHGDYTDLDEPVAAAYDCYVDELFVQATWNAGGVFTFDNHPVGVWFSPSSAWAIINEDGAPMPVGASFNVYLISAEEIPANAAAFFIQNAAGGSSIDYLDDPALNSNPSAQLLVSQYFGYPVTVANPHQIGIWYDPTAGRWAIYNEDQAPIPAGAAFNVMALPPRGLFFNSFTQEAISSNTSGDSTCINNPQSNQNPNAKVYVTHIFHPHKVKPVPYNGYFPDVPGVWYNTSLGEWCVFDGSYNTMPLGAWFSVAIP